MFRFQVTALTCALLLSGCATTPPRAAYSASDLAVAKPLDANPVRFWADDDVSAYRQWGETLTADRKAANKSPPETLLALSGGADKGAFSAGLLNAWSKRGDRPDFDIVTGVSTGALIAPFAFLGQGEDATIKAIYTGISSKNIYRQRVLSGLFGGASLLDTKPLQALIAKHVTLPFLDRIAQHYRSGHRLLVLTTNIDAQRGVIWDMGAIAASPAPERLTLFRQILLASSSIPGAFPPVLVPVSANGRHFAEMHVDGGAVSGFFVLPRGMLAASPASGSRRGEIYLLYNGRIDPAFEVVKPKTFGIMSRALSTVLGQLDRTNVADMRKFAQDNRLDLSVCTLDNRFTQTSKTLFDPIYMQALYDFGARLGAASNDCLKPARHAP